MLASSRRIADRESDYHRRRLARALSPTRHDPFAPGAATPAAGARTYADAAAEAALARETDNTLVNIQRAARREAEAHDAAAPTRASGLPAPAKRPAPAPAAPDAKKQRSEWDDDDDAAPGAAAAAPSRWDATPGSTPSRRARSRWDETPAGLAPGAATPAWGATPGATPAGGAGMATPLVPGHAVQLSVEQYKELRAEADAGARSKPLTDADLDALLPGEEDGYKVVNPPDGYAPIRTPARKLLATPTPLAGAPGYYIIPADESSGAGGYDIPREIEGLPDMKPDDAQYFGKLLKDVDEAALSADEARERKIMKLLLKVKNGAPPQRKSALRALGERAREFGPGPLFNQILPLLMSPTLEDQERHLLVKVVDRVLHTLDDAVRPYVHKILVVIEPLLIDEDHYARVEGREIIANLAKAAGLATMIAAMRPDIDAVDEYVRNTTARAFAVVASALGVPALLPFLKAVCRSKKSWQARHTGIKVVQQAAILMGCSVLPHLAALVDVVKGGVTDDNQKVRTVTALTLAALAEAAAPYGIEAFDDVLEPLWRGVRLLRGKTLAAFLKAIGCVIPLMDATYANYYTREVVPVLVREFASPDDEMKKIVLSVVARCVAADGVPAAYVASDVAPDFFKHFWVRRMALDRRNYRAVVDTTAALAARIGVSAVVGRVVEDLKDEAEPYRRMVVDAIDRVLTAQGAADIDARLEEVLVDGMLFAFQEATETDTTVVLKGFGTVVTSLGPRAAPYLPQIVGTIKWRLNNKSAKVRQQAADLVARVAPTLAACGEDKLLAHLGVVLYEYLGEEYPDVLGSILGALRAVVAVVGMDRMTPPVKDILPRLTPILKNRHEKVLEACIDLVGRIADRGAEAVPPREWMRVCFDLLDTLRAYKKAIRRAAVATFGFIARAIGPQDVLVALLNNLRVQERQNRVCTTVAIAVVAEACAPFTVLPALMNEYRVPELNVRNGVLKSLSFLFEYVSGGGSERGTSGGAFFLPVPPASDRRTPTTHTHPSSFQVGEAGKDYVHAVAPLLADALSDRDLVHRQTASFAVQHIALGVPGLGCEDALVHLLNHVWPNIFEPTPHIALAVAGAVDGCRVALGAPMVLNYVLQVGAGGRGGRERVERGGARRASTTRPSPPPHLPRRACSTPRAACGRRTGATTTRSSWGRRPRSCRRGRRRRTRGGRGTRGPTCRCLFEKEEGGERVVVPCVCVPVVCLAHSSARRGRRRAPLFSTIPRRGRRRPPRAAAHRLYRARAALPRPPCGARARPRSPSRPSSRSRPPRPTASPPRSSTRSRRPPPPPRPRPLAAPKRSRSASTTRWSTSLGPRTRPTWGRRTPKRRNRTTCEERGRGRRGLGGRRAAAAARAPTRRPPARPPVSRPPSRPSSRSPRPRPATTPAAPRGRRRRRRRRRPPRPRPRPRPRARGGQTRAPPSATRPPRARRPSRPPSRSASRTRGRRRSRRRRRARGGGGASTPKSTASSTPKTTSTSSPPPRTRPRGSRWTRNWCAT